MNLRRLLCLFALLILTCCAGLGAPTPAPVTLRVAGSTSMVPMLEELAASIQVSRPGILVDVRASDSQVGLNELLAGTADLAAVSWRGEKNAVPDGFQAVPVASDGIAIIVHPRSRLPGLTLLQVRALYRGEILDWNALGEPTGEPTIVSREDGSGTRSAFETLVMGSDRVTLNALVMPSSQDVVNYVSGHRSAVGYVSMAALTDTVRAVPVEGLLPTHANVRAGAYHLTRVLYLYAPAPAPPPVQAFLDYVLSPAGQAVVARHDVALR